jgi:hypothetical protein
MYPPDGLPFPSISRRDVCEHITWSECFPLIVACMTVLGAVMGIAFLFLLYEIRSVALCY